MIGKLKSVLLVITMLVIVFWGYVMIVNRNSINMTGKQKILKTFYPVILWMNRVTNKNRTILTHENAVTPVSFYSLKVVLNNGDQLDMASLKGKKILLVNTASACGYTAQYDQLQQLFNLYKGSLIIIGFPANDFKDQEAGNDTEIASFCKKNFGVSFPLAQKSIVIKNTRQNTVFQWLTDPAKNGWNSRPPSWNFSKYLVNEDGALINYFDPGIEPTGKELEHALAPR